MVELVSVSQMKLIESKSNELGTSYEKLMENAGFAAFKLIADRVGIVKRKCMIFCGSGNNGGDGLVLARYAIDVGADVTIVFVGGYPKSQMAIANMEKVKALNIPMLSVDFNEIPISAALGNVDIIIDAIYGTGFHGKLRPQDKDIFQKINNAVAAVFSLDVPSGIDCDTGEFDEDCIKADFTITFDSIKPCHILPSSIEHCGFIDVVDIGIPEEARQSLFCKTSILTEAIVKELVPQRDDQGHKGTFGKLINIAGSRNFTGAAVLSSLGGFASGAGYVTLISTNDVCKIVAGCIPEVTYIQINNDEYGMCKLPKMYDIMAIFDTAKAIAIGCGLGRGKNIAEFITEMITMQNNPVVIDADGINGLNGNIDILSRAKCPVIITPHPGEMAKLLGCSIEEVEKDRFNKASALARHAGITVVLKGHNTLIATSDGELYINCTGNSGLSKAGSGDILTGLIAGFCAQGLSAKDASLIAVYIHGLAGEKCSKRLSKHTMRPSDIIADIGDIFREWEL